MRMLPATALLTLSLSACASPVPPPNSQAGGPPPNAKTGGTLPPLRDPCTADAAKGLVGREATAEVVEQARLAAHADTARVLKPDTIVTMEYRSSRLNIDVDDDNIIVDVRCG